MAKKKEKFFYRVVYDTLKDEILSGVYAYNEYLPSEREICERFQMDRTTVRAALSMLVSDNLVVKKAGAGTKVILGAEKEIGLRQRSNDNIIGFFMPKSDKMTERITQPFYAELFYNLEVFLKAHDYTLIYTTLENEQEMQDFIGNHGIRGAVFLSAVDPQLLMRAKYMKLPSILVNRLDNDFTCVLGNNIDGAYTAIKHLLENRHRKIGIISGPPNYITTKERLVGCEKAFAEYGIPFDRAIIIPGNWDFKSGAEATKAIVSTEDPRPTAIFSFNDAMALGAIRTLHDLHLRVPQDISVMGFDNLNHLKSTEPNLTTIDTQVERMAQVVGYNLIGLISGLLPTGMRIDVPTNLVERKTVMSL